MSFFLLFLYTYANFLIKNGQVEDREGDKEGKEQCVLGTHSIRNKKTGTDGARGEAAAGGSLLLTVWVSDSEPFLSSILTSAKAFYPTFTDPRSLKRERGVK